MTVFITGSTGFIGSVVAATLHRHGYDVLALARSHASASRLKTKGYRVLRGDLTDTAILADGARQADGVIHLGLRNEGDIAGTDAADVRAMLAAIAGTTKPFIYTSGVWVLGATTGAPADEGAPLAPIPLIAWRGEVEPVVLGADARGVVLRPGVVHGRGGGIPAMFTASGRGRGAVRLVEPGTQRWPFVHVDDLADLYMRALDAPGGTVLHGISEPAVRVRDVAEAASHAAGVPGRIEPWSLADARTELGAFADALALDQHVESTIAQRVLGWEPQRPGILEELREGSYVPLAEQH